MPRVIFMSFLFISIITVHAWDQEELEIFDLVEEINLNFYEVLGVQQDATLQEIKKRFRNLSIVLHPDKNDAEDANIQFRNLVAIYEVLKDSSKREKYDNVLKNGLPNWKSALYYYRHVRKMGLVEMTGILFIILSIGQYIIAWAAYVEKKYTAASIFETRLKKLQKKNKTNIDMDTILNSIPTPSIKNTLPFQIPRIIWQMPSKIKHLYGTYTEYKKLKVEEQKREAEEIERQQLLEEELVKEREAKKENVRRRKEKNAIKEKTDEELKGFSHLNLKSNRNQSSIKPVNNKEQDTVSGGLWTDEDLVELVRLVKKYPGGTGSRWEIIAEFMNRSVTEVTFMAAKMKENGYRIPGQIDSVAENIVQEATKKMKTKRTTAANTDSQQIILPETNWSQEQQQLLEAAIVKYPKGGSSDRWQKIANNIPGKTKEECLARYKYLVEIVKAQQRKVDVVAINEDQNNLKETEDLQLKTNVDRHQNIKREISNKTDDDKIIETEELNNKQKQIKKGKPKNKRKERKRQMDFTSSSEEIDQSDDENV